jgi:hypothetical protein
MASSAWNDDALRSVGILVGPVIPAILRWTVKAKCCWNTYLVLHSVDRRGFFEHGAAIGTFRYICLMQERAGDDRSGLSSHLVGSAHQCAILVVDLIHHNSVLFRHKRWAEQKNASIGLPI